MYVESTLCSYYGQHDNMFRPSVGYSCRHGEATAVASFYFAYRHQHRYMYGKSAAKTNISVWLLLALKWCF